MNKITITIGTIALATSAISVLARPERPQMGERPNPEDLVVEIVADYDSNTDNFIDVVELEAAIVGIHEKRMEKMKAFAESRELDGDRPRRGGPKGNREAPNPAEISSRLISDFDNNGDEVLDTEELLGAVHALHSRGPGRGGPREKGRKGGRHAPDDVVE